MEMYDVDAADFDNDEKRWVVVIAMEKKTKKCKNPKKERKRVLNLKSFMW